MHLSITEFIIVFFDFEFCWIDYYVCVGGALQNFLLKNDPSILLLEKYTHLP